MYGGYGIHGDTVFTLTPGAVRIITKWLSDTRVLQDEVGQSKYLGSIGNVRLRQGKLSEALRCYNEALSLNYDESCRITALQNRALVYIKLGTKLTGKNGMKSH